MKKSIILPVFKVVGVLAALSALTACAVYAPPVCNPPGAYAQGVDDGHARLPAQNNYAASCPVRHYRINQAYYRGYRHGQSLPVIHIDITPAGPYPGPHWRRLFN